MENERKLYVFHHNDMDGYAALYEVMKHYHLPMKYDVNKFRQVNYESNAGDKFAAVEEGSEVVIVDYSFTEKTLYQLQGLLDKHCLVTWIDHHDSSINLYEKHPDLMYIPGIRNKCMSGAALTCIFYSYFAIDVTKVNHDMLRYDCPKWIQLVSDYDTWTHEFNGEENFFKLGWDTFTAKERFSLMESLDSVEDYNGNLVGEETLNELVNIGQAIKEYIDTDNERYCRSLGYESQMYDTTKCFVVNRMSNSWIFGDRIKKYPICVTAVFDGDEWGYTLFSTNPNIDCSKYAEYYGGGGHKGAAGFRSKENIFKKV